VRSESLVRDADDAHVICAAQSRVALEPRSGRKAIKEQHRWGVSE
jgi:hypothetical protein